MGYSELQDRLANDEIVVLDGGMGTEVKRRTGKPGTSVLAVNEMVESPDLIKSIHTSYIDAGADVITANTYDLNGPALAKPGLDADDAWPLTSQAVRIAREAREEATNGRDVLIAGSLGPLGSDYDPDDVPDYDTCLAAYREQVEVMADEGVDMVLVETTARVRSARAGVAAAAEVGLPAWAALLADDHGRVKSAEPLDAAVDTLVSEGASAVLINCTQPPQVSRAMESLSQYQRVPFGAYAQAAVYTGKGWEFGPSRTPQEYLDCARDWVSKGARIVGGCCGTNPDHIKALRSHFSQP